MKLTLAGMMVLGLVLIGCGDDDDGDVDAGRDAAVAPDAAMGDAATGDAAMGDAAMMDAAMADAATDGGGGAFSSTLALTTAEEVPPCTAAGEGAMGAGTITIDEANTTIEVMITFEGLSAAPVAGHIHTGASGEAGPPVLPFEDLTTPIMETFTAADYPSPAPAGAPATFVAFLAAMRAGDTYVNLHTDACPAGEIRDQIE